MTGTEIITYIANNVDTFFSPVNIVTGAVFTSLFLRKNTKIQEFEKIKAGKLNEVADDLLASGKMSYTEYYKAKNFLAIAKKADEINKAENVVLSEESYNFDWFIRLYENAGNVSEQQIQELWARILANEIKKPNSYSLLTLEKMKNMGKQEAELFKKIVSHCVFRGYHGFLPAYDQYTESCGISYSDIMYLSEHGLMYNDAMLVLELPVVSEGDIAFVSEELLIYIKPENEQKTKVKIKQFPLTSTGREIATLVDDKLSAENFIKFAKCIKESDKKVDVKVHKIVKLDEQGITYDDSDILQGE